MSVAVQIVGLELTTEVVEDNTEDQRGIREMKEVGRKALVTNRLPPCAVHTSYYYSMHHILCYYIKLFPTTIL